MDEKVQKQSINRLDIKEDVISILENNSIENIGQLCRKTKTDLKKIELGQNDIGKIEIELQLLGLNLRNNI